jgi:uncharacterized protein
MFLTQNTMNYSIKLLSVGLALTVTGCLSQPKITSSQNLPISAKFQANNQVIKLEVAKTPKEQATGLMYRTFLDDNRGMLFEFRPAQKLKFWMKNCKIPLDIIFLRNGVVIAIAAKAPPCTADPCPNHAPPQPIDQVIEIRGSRATELGIKTGDQIKIKVIQ